MLLLFFIVLASSASASVYGDCLDDCTDVNDACITYCGSPYGGCHVGCLLNYIGCLIQCNQTDEDGDGVTDNDDTLIGDEDDVITQGVANLTVFIGNTQSNHSNASTMDGTQNVRFIADNNTIVEFDNDFDENSVELVDVTIKKQTINGLNGMVVKNLELPESQTKTIYVDRSVQSGSICIADKEIDDVSDISRECTEDDEYFFGRCDQGEEIDGVRCDIENNRYKISGLQNSGAVELNISGIFMGYFTVEYMSEATNHQEGKVMPGEGIKVCFESARSVGEEEYIRLIFTPQYGGISVNEVWTPPIVNTYVVNIYPIGMG